jgi:class 3 adenylate cyclase
MASLPTRDFRWTWDLRAPPAALWSLVSATDRFNRDCGYPPVTVVSPPPENGYASDGVPPPRRLRAVVAGVVVEWDEHAFEWVEPRRFAVERRYHRGPVARMVMSCSLEPLAGGGTRLTYAMALTPASRLGGLLLPFAIGRQARAKTEAVFQRYDELALRHARRSPARRRRAALAPGGSARLAAIVGRLGGERAADVPLLGRLEEFVTTADDLGARRMRPYELADDWGAPRREVLHLCLRATRAGLLDFSWDLICPHCRGAKVREATLATLKPEAHCDTCNLDFTANFDQSVELTFAPNPAIRAVPHIEYCVGGPQITPHIVAQQTLRPAETRELPLTLEPGRYRVRTAGVAEQHAFRVEAAGAEVVDIPLQAKPLDEPVVAPDVTLRLVNDSDAARLAIVERLAWSDQAATAAEVTSLQVFRDLFSREVLRRGEQISVRALTIVFTDLKNSTLLYQTIGDAPAFGRVLTHFELLRIAIDAGGGAIVKTMGDAVMAVFTRPEPALLALRQAQRWLAHPEEFTPPPGFTAPVSTLQPLALKASIHCGPCLAINQNDRLDYFGTTVNFAARLCGLCTGEDLVLSSAARQDPEVAARLASAPDAIAALAEPVRLKGFGETSFEVWRVR